MDRISALRNVEEALAAFEAGECDLADLERRVRGVLRTYATEFEGDLRPYRATGDVEAVVLADSRAAARERVRRLYADAAGEGGADGQDDADAVETADGDADADADDPGDAPSFTVERVGGE